MDAPMEDHLMRFARTVVPRLDARAYKGSHGGKIAVIGGSATYAGAPFYAAMGAARAGADLVRVFTSKTCAPVLKGYSPDLIVHAPWDDDGFDGGDVERTLMCQWFERVDAMVLGPGLGGPHAEYGAGVRYDVVCEWAFWMLDVCKYYPVVYDADGLQVFNSKTWGRGDECFAASRYASVEVGGTGSFWWDIATPNKMELFRLIQWSPIPDTIRNKYEIEADGWDAAHECRCDRVEDVNVDDEFYREEVIGKALEHFAPVNFVLKGDTDWLFINCGNGRPNGEFIPIGGSSFPGAPKRCGGQGDILAGILATFLAWAHRRYCDQSHDEPDYHEARTLFIATVVAACYVTRGAVERGFDDIGRGLQASDVLKHIPSVFAHKFERGDDE